MIKLADLIKETKTPRYLYKWMDSKTFQKYTAKGILPSRRNYAHFIESENQMVPGNSFTDEANIAKWKSDHDTLVRIDTSSIPNKVFPVAGNRTYLRTKGMTDKNFDPTAWEFESEDIDEFWIEGNLDLKQAQMVVVSNNLPV